MKVAIDLDGTLLRYPAGLLELAKCLKSGGHTVGILTARRGDDKIFNSVSNYYKEKVGVPLDFFYFKTNETSEELIGDFKARMIYEHEINMIIDDFVGSHPGVMDTFMDRIIEYGLDGKVLIFHLLFGEEL
jgi:hypothetical protein